MNSKKLTDIATYWHKTQDRLLHLKDVKTPVSLIVHSRREVNASLREGLYFFVDIARDGVILYELDNEPLAAPKRLTPQQAYEQKSTLLPEEKSSIPSLSQRSLGLRNAICPDRRSCCTKQLSICTEHCSLR